MFQAQLQPAVGLDDDLDDANNKQYAVKAVTGYKGVNGRHLWQSLWAGRWPKRDQKTWEPSTNFSKDGLRACGRFVRGYRKALRIKKREVHALQTLPLSLLVCRESLVPLSALFPSLRGAVCSTTLAAAGSRLS